MERVPVFLPAWKVDAVKSHYVNVLTPLGARHISRVLSETGDTPRWRRSLLPHPWQPVLHAYWIREFAIGEKVAIESQVWRFWSWFDDRQLAALKKERGARFRTIPDGFFVVTDPATHKHFSHFVEIDLGTQTTQARTRGRPDWRGKVEGYLHYFERDFREQFGLSSLPLVLTVTTAERRLENLLAVTGQAGGGGRFWFTTIDELLTRTPNPSPEGREGAFLAPVWQVPTIEPDSEPGEPLGL